LANYGTNADLIPELAADLVKAHVDVIYAAGDPAIRAAQGATKTIPILGVTEDMVAAGLLARSLDPAAIQQA
jgi:putative tryptophan/tyrosine transport system substrate-binding protein